MIDFRYHLASLSAVFIALGLGILIGNSFVGLASAQKINSWVERLGRDLQSMRQEIDKVRRENLKLAQEIQLRDQIDRLILPTVVNRVLEGKRVALIVCGGVSSNLKGTITGVLSKAGAQVLSVTTLPDDWLPEEKREAIAHRLLLFSSLEKRDLHLALAKALVSGIWSQALQRVQLLCPQLRLEGDYTQPVDLVVLLTQANSQERLARVSNNDTPEMPFLQAWLSLNLPVVIGEPKEARSSLIPLFLGKPVVTVDNIDTALGQMALVLGAKVGKGHYGVKETADLPLPDMNAQERGASSR